MSVRRSATAQLTSGVGLSGVWERPHVHCGSLTFLDGAGLGEIQVPFLALLLLF